MQAYFRLIHRKLRSFDKQVFGVWGFKGIWDYVSTVLGLSIMPFFNLQLIVAGAAAWYIWVSKWIWAPPMGAILIFSMTIINAYYSFKVDKRIKKIPFSFQKVSHTFSIICTDLLIMAIINMAIQIYSYYEPLADVLFGWYFANKLRQILYNMTLLQLQQGGLARFLKTYIMQFLKSKIGSDVLASMQDDDRERSRKKEKDEPLKENEDEYPQS